MDQPGELWEVVVRPVGFWGSSEAAAPRDGAAGHVAAGNVVHGLHDGRSGGGLFGAAENVGLDGADGGGGLDDKEVLGHEEELLLGAEDESGPGRAAVVENEAG